MKKYFEELTHQYEVNKTLRNELRPIGKTRDYIRERGLIEEDEERDQNYKRVKKLIDEYHKKVINESLEDVTLEHLSETAELYFQKKRGEKGNKQLNEAYELLRKDIVKALKSHEDYGKLSSGKELIEKELPKFVDKEEDYQAISSFNKFTTYFKNYNTIRQHLYSDEAKSSTVAYRLINENLPRFLDNIRVFEMTRRTELTWDEAAEVCFVIENYPSVLTQKGINQYNEIVGGFNSKINLYNQSHKKDGRQRLPKMKVLYKQILQDREALFNIEAFENDGQLLESLENYGKSVKIYLEGESLEVLSAAIRASEGKGIYVKNDVSLTTFSAIVTDHWSTLSDGIRDDYDRNYTGKKKGEKYEEERRKKLKARQSYEFSYLQEFCANNPVDQYLNKLQEDVDHILRTWQYVEQKVFAEHDRDRKLSKNHQAVDAIREFLDAIKELERDLKLIRGSEQETDRNLLVYGEWSAVLEEICKVDNLYNMTRNYLTKKAFKVDKIKLNFQSDTLLDGWSEEQKGVIFRDAMHFYLGIPAKGCSKCLDDLATPEDLNDRWEQMKYYQCNQARLNVPKLFCIDGTTEMKTKDLENLRNKYLPPEIHQIHLNKSYKKTSKNFDPKDLSKYIAYYSERVKEYYQWCDFSFKEPNAYVDFNEFTDHVRKQAYQISFVPISRQAVINLVDKGKLYLFQIHNKDFSGYSKGNLNLHTIYLKMLFDERNLADTVYQLNGGGEIFYRKGSIEPEDMVVHRSGEALKNKNEARRRDKETSTFPYDITKDKRYTGERFFLHLPITMNFGCAKPKEQAKGFNQKINQIIKESEGVNVIGIDRGERNLLYLVAVDGKGNILEQKSLNEIVNKKDNLTIETNYHTLLDNREKDRDKARKDWKTIDNIEDLKEGYMSQVVHIMAEWILKYNAIVVLEDLNSGFKRGRQKVEKQVYQKFEKMLIEKLNYLVIDKSREQEEPEKVGGALNALQLTEPFETFKEMEKQTGMIYYVPAYLTSKIDPTTGFANLFYSLKYENKEKAQMFFQKFDRISYNATDDYFEFAFDYSNFPTQAEGAQTKWIVCSHGEKFSNAKQNHMRDEEIDPTKQLKALFQEHSIVYEDGTDLRASILSVEEVSFYKQLITIFKRILQMRNYTQDGKEDYIISPVKNAKGYFYHSAEADDALPRDADANGAYNIAKKGLWIIEQLKNAENLSNVELTMTKQQWLTYAQTHTLG